MALNLSRLDLVSMRLVVLCAETGSLSCAARRANCSLSAGSQRLTALEQSIGRLLFRREPRGLRLTGDGELFVRHARQILADLDRLIQQLDVDLRVRTTATSEVTAKSPHSCSTLRRPPETRARIGRISASDRVRHPKETR